MTCTYIHTYTEVPSTQLLDNCPREMEKDFKTKTCMQVFTSSFIHNSEKLGTNQMSVSWEWIKLYN